MKVLEFLRLNEGEAFSLPLEVGSFFVIIDFKYVTQRHKTKVV